MAKKNSDYWQGRFEQLEKASHKDALTTYSHIEQSFEQAQREIERNINNWYVRFANNNQITITEAKKILNANELKELKWDIQEYIKYGQENELNAGWMKELENASAKFHISRLEALKLQTQQTLEKLFGNELDEVDRMTSNTYTNNYYYTMFEMQKGFNVGFNIGTIDENKLSKIVSKPWAVDEKNFSERIWNNKTKMINELHNQLTIMCIQGKSPDSVIKYMSKKFNTSKAQAGNLVMTESSYFSSLAQKDCFKDLDVEEYEIVATLDSHTSSICQEQDGKVYKMNDYQPGVTAPPFHNYCRSTTVPHFNDDYDIKDTRAARDEDGKTYYVESINATFKQLDELQNQYPLNNEIFVRNKTMSSAAAQGNYQGISINTAHFNKANRTALVGDDWIKDCDKQIEDLKQYLGNMKYKQKPIEKGIKRLEEQKKYNCFSVSGSYSDLESIKATISHEYGHVVADQYFGQVNQSRANKNFDFFDSNECWQKCNDVADTYYKAIKNNDIYNISYYASTDRYEFFAECFAKKQMGGTLPDYINEMLERVLKNGK